MNAVLKQWLLNLAIDFPVSFHLLPKLLNGDDREPSPVNVRPLHGFTLAQGVDRLVQLADMGLIAFKQEISEGKTRPIPVSELSCLEVPLESKDRLKGITFELTQTGGNTWERAANPSWFDMEDGFAIPRYANDDLGRGDLVGWDWTLFSQNREHLMASLGWWSTLYDEQLDFRTVELRRADHYKVRYWKRLPNVYIATFQTRCGSTPAWSHGRTPQWFTEWRIARSSWHRHPWEMEGWPALPDQ